MNKEEVFCFSLSLFFVAFLWKITCSLNQTGGQVLVCYRGGGGGGKREVGAGGGVRRKKGGGLGRRESAIEKSGEKSFVHRFSLRFSL